MRLRNKDEVYSEGMEKRVSKPDEFWYVLKIFKPWKIPLSFEEQKNNLALKKQYFWDYIPETELIILDGWKYGIKQKFVKGNLLKDLNVSDLSAKTLEDLLDLLQKYLRYCKEQNSYLDIFGYQQYLNCSTSFERKFRNFLGIYKNFLLSTNILITQEGKVFMVDVCDSKKNQSFFKKISKKFFIPLTLNKISKLTIKKKSETGKILQSEEKLENK